MAKGTVLVIDDEKDLIELVRYNLELAGFQVWQALDGETGLAAAARELPDVVIVDLMLPGIDGLEVCRQLRSQNRTAQIPVIMLTAKAAEPDKVVGLELGADDYITKPFSPRELVARVKAILRRSSGKWETPEVIRRADLVIDTARRQVTCDGAAIALTATEFRLLQFLSGRPGRVFSRSELIDGVLGSDVAVMDRTIDVHITALRRKLGKSGARIETIRGFGYRFREEKDA
jgi:two-component system alkaline phosphatase synthesis response regulator PhoP